MRLLRWMVLAMICGCVALGTGQLVAPAWAAPGVCLGPVCADEITRSAKHHFQLRLRVTDQQGHHERLTVDCRQLQISPAQGSVERGHVAALAQRACRLAGEGVG